MLSRRALALLVLFEVCVIFGCCSKPLRIKVFYDKTVENLKREQKTIVKQVHWIISILLPWLCTEYYGDFSLCQKQSNFGRMPCKLSNPASHQFKCHTTADMDTTQTLHLLTPPQSIVLVVVLELSCVERALLPSNTLGNAMVALKDTNHPALRTSYTNTNIIFDSKVDIVLPITGWHITLTLTPVMLPRAEVITS